MKTIKTPRAMQREALRLRRLNRRIALVPTMGALHAGHLSLVRRARKLAGAGGVVVVSVYVNPTQFAPNEDFGSYPRNLKKDLGLCRAAGVDIVFAPTDATMYPAGKQVDGGTLVMEEGLSSRLEGRSRPTHFRGVTTVVLKLFQLVQPQSAVFGAKDWQQAMIIRKMVKDLNVPVRITVAKTYREADGLALSSRNQYLSESERRQATVLWDCLQIARRAVRGRKTPVAAGLLRRRLLRRLEQEPDARVDYVEFFDPETLTPARQVCRGVHFALAVYVGKTRLIDNGRL